MDNQQERLNSWLGGIVDGEGCITMNTGISTNKNKRPKSKNFGRNFKWIRYSPIVTIVNRNEKVISRVIEILKSNGIAFYVWARDYEMAKCITIRIHGVKRVLRMLDFIIPYLVGKQEVALLAKQYCENRIAQGNKPLSDQDLELAKKIRQVNCVTSAKSSETIRQPRYWREDIVRSCVKA